MSLRPAGSSLDATVRPTLLWFRQPGHYAHEVTRASHAVPVQWIDGRRAAPSGRLFNVFTIEHIGRTVTGINDCSHRDVVLFCCKYDLCYGCEMLTK
jgi:hypothetical protein